MSGLAKSLGIWIAAGTMPLKTDDPHRVTNTMLVYDAFGQEAARYDKIHLFLMKDSRNATTSRSFMSEGIRPSLSTSH